MHTLIRLLLALQLVGLLIIAVNVTAHADAEDASSEWTLSPSTPAEGLVGPRNEEGAGKTGIAHLGHQRGKDGKDGKDGDPSSYVEKEVKCGTEGEWCKTILVVGFYQSDEERLKITLTASDGTQTSVFLNGPTDTVSRGDPSTREVTVSSKGCKECKIRVEIIASTKSKKKNIQSHASVKVSGGYPKCTKNDKMNAEGRLVDENGKALPQPGATER